MDCEKPNTYAKAGVDIKREEQAISEIKDWMNKTFRFRKGKVGGVLGEIGSFANLIDLGEYALAVCTDGVGSKVLVAQELGKYDTVGIDLVAMNVNDLICLGAEPICMVDYLAMQCMDYSIAKEIAAGIYLGAEQAQVSVIGGETASLPEIICGVGKNGFDLAGTAVGLIKKDKIITGKKIREGDAVLGFASSGIHSNGLSLARKVLPKNMWLNLLAPTRIYVQEILSLSRGYDFHGLANITGGGVLNLLRLTCDFGFKLDNMPKPQMVFRQIKKEGEVSPKEMYKTFNMGVGFVAVVSEDAAEKIVGKHGSDYQVAKIGEVVGEPGVEVVLEDESLTYKP
ncbi:MAG: phosphoribosylformylglycinamidine cyclo-ligase [Candidatus Altiarchaeales archaeon]|nr:phosphoribosylformylglycinamidine cyclo-ligase [Candidatus Altiarchaeales archaeon]